MYAVFCLFFGFFVAFYTQKAIVFARKSNCLRDTNTKYYSIILPSIINNASINNASTNDTKNTSANDTSTTVAVLVLIMLVLSQFYSNRTNNTMIVLILQ